MGSPERTSPRGWAPSPRCRTGAPRGGEPTISRERMALVSRSRLHHVRPLRTWLSLATGRPPRPKIVPAASRLRREPLLPIEPEPYGTPLAAFQAVRVSQPCSASAKHPLSRSPHPPGTSQALSPSSLHRPSLTRRFTTGSEPRSDRPLSRLALGSSAAPRLVCRTAVFKGPPAPVVSAALRRPPLGGTHLHSRMRLRVDAHWRVQVYASRLEVAKRLEARRPFE